MGLFFEGFLESLSINSRIHQKIFKVGEMSPKRYLELYTHIYNYCTHSNNQQNLTNPHHTKQVNLSRTGEAVTRLVRSTCKVGCITVSVLDGRRLFTVSCETQTK